MAPLFPHQKLDWSIRRLEERCGVSPDDPAARVALARAILSRALFHGTGERECNQALALVRRALQDDPADAEALVIGGLALVGMERPQAAQRYLDQALRIDAERPDLRLALGRLAVLNGDLRQAVSQLESACRGAAESWEVHLDLGRALLILARDGGTSQRRLERAQYHLIRALRLEPSPEEQLPLLRDLGLSCMLNGRYREAEKFFIRLRESERYASTARYHLGLVALGLGKHHNAILHFRQYLRARPDDARVLAQMAMAWFHLGEFPRAREACNQALMADPENVKARHALGCCFLEEGQPAEGLRIFRELLSEHPGHMPSYVEMVRTRRLAGDLRWLEQALEVEVGHFDRATRHGGLDGRSTTLERIGVLLGELRAVGPSTINVVLRQIPRTQDEALRFRLYDAACTMALGAVADETSARLREAGRTYGVELGSLALSTAEALPEPVLMAGLGLREADLRRAAVDRHGPAHDVETHRVNLDRERVQARAHQALLLLSVGLRQTVGGRELLQSWAESADPDLATAAWVGLATFGEPEAVRRLRDRAASRACQPVIDRLLERVGPRTDTPRAPRRVARSEQMRCSTCGRQSSEVEHMISGGRAVICDRCAVRVSRERSDLRAPDDASCQLCDSASFESGGVSRFNGVDVCDGCLQWSLGLLEREEVEEFLASW